MPRVLGRAAVQDLHRMEEGDGSPLQPSDIDEEEAVRRALVVSEEEENAQWEGLNAVLT